VSFKRVEAAYAHFMGDSTVDGAMMSSLQALAFVANANDGERCFPSEAYIASLTHDSLSTVKRALGKLKEKGIVDWVQGGNVAGRNLANTYRFLFPLVGMGSGRTRYERLKEPPKVSLVPEAANIPPVQDEPPVGSFCTPGYVQDEPPVGSGRTTNKELSGDNNKVSKSEGTSMPMISIEDFSKDVAARYYAIPNVPSQPVPRPASPPPEGPYSPIREAMRVCGVTDRENAATFTRVMAWRDIQDCLEVIWRFDSEIRAGEHGKLRNKAAELTRRLMELPAGK